jgi:mevalonate kinase
MNIGFATAGSGNGGCVWALAREPEQITKLTDQWQSILNEIPTAQILNVAIDVQGLKVEQITPQN